MTRHELREQLFKLLFRIEFHEPEDMPEQGKLFFETEEVAFLPEDQEYITEKFGKIQEKLTKIDELLEEKTEKWSVSRIGKVELSILRLAVYEILFDDTIPESVAINEAVELAKRFGQENAGSFVNAVLAKFVKKGE